MFQFHPIRGFELAVAFVYAHKLWGLVPVGLAVFGWGIAVLQQEMNFFKSDDKTPRDLGFAFLTVVELSIINSFAYFLMFSPVLIMVDLLKPIFVVCATLTIIGFTIWMVLSTAYHNREDSLIKKLKSETLRRETAERELASFRAARQQ